MSDFVDVGAPWDASVEWLSSNQRSVDEAARSGWVQYRALTPTGPGPVEPVVASLGGVARTTDSARFGLEWSTLSPAGLRPFMTGDLVVQALHGDQTHLEVQCSYRALPGAEIVVPAEDRPAMLYCLRSFLGRLAS